MNNRMASMYGKDLKHISMNDYMDRPPVYNNPTATGPKEQQHTIVLSSMDEETEMVECTPFMCTHPMGLLRWFQLLMFFILQWLVQITCGRDACTMIMNVFGYIALGQVFVLLILLFMSIICVLILIAYSLNAHRSFPGIILAVERLYAVFGIILFLVAGILGAWMAGLTVNEEYNYQGRGDAHIRPQWIAAAVIEFLMVIVYILDLLLQRREGYPFFQKKYKQAETQPRSEYMY